MQRILHFRAQLFLASHRTARVVAEERSAVGGRCGVVSCAAELLVPCPLGCELKGDGASRQQLLVLVFIIRAFYRILLAATAHRMPRM